MSDDDIIPPPLPLTRQSGLSPAWWRSHYDTAMTFWKHACSAFPEYFQGELLIHAVRVTPNKLSDIRYHKNGGSYDPDDVHMTSLYLIGDYVGEVIKHLVDTPDDIRTGDLLFTPVSYYSYSTAMYEASLIAQDSIKTMLRHLLYAGYQMDSTMSIDMMLELVLFTGVIPGSDSDHARASESRQAE